MEWVVGELCKKGIGEGETERGEVGLEKRIIWDAGKPGQRRQLVCFAVSSVILNGGTVAILCHLQDATPWIGSCQFDPAYSFSPRR